MLFNSYIFLLFFLPVCVILYFFLNKREWHQAALIELILMSFWFYAYNNWRYLFILVVSIVLNWLFSRILLCDKVRCRKLIVSLGILLNLCIIFYYKYYNFFLDNVNFLFKRPIELKEILLPLGISFYTFQQISYLLDSYHGETKDYRFLEYAAFVSFFPQLVAGPIVLHDEIIPQFRDISKRKFSHTNFAFALYSLSIGLFKKVIVADTFGKAVSWGFTNIDTLSSLEIILIMLFYTMQIYFDFSGYSDMAIGIARMFNIILPVNFNSPYKAYSIIDFWKHWHITLTRFFRKYVYIPLGGSRKGQVCTYINVFIVFLLSGIWHGANWTFILWGIIHGIANVLNRIFREKWEKFNPVFQWMCTFLFINITWLIFRADNVSQAFLLLKRVMCLDSFTVRKELTDCFVLEELALLRDYFKPFGMLCYKINGFYMWIFLMGSIFACLNLKNIQEKEFKPTMRKAISTAFLFIWVIVSLAGISTFLYFNF